GFSLMVRIKTVPNIRTIGITNSSPIFDLYIFFILKLSFLTVCRFTLATNVLRVAAVGDFGALHCQPAQKFNRSTQLQFCMSPPIEATRCYHQCFLVCRGLSVYLLLLYSLSFLLRWLCKLFDKALVAVLACAALAMCLQNGWIKSVCF